MENIIKKIIQEELEDMGLNPDFYSLGGDDFLKEPQRREFEIIRHPSKRKRGPEPEDRDRKRAPESSDEKPADVPADAGAGIAPREPGSLAPPLEIDPEFKPKKALPEPVDQEVPSEPKPKKSWDQKRRDINKAYKTGKIDKAEWRKQRRAHTKAKPPSRRRRSRPSPSRRKRRRSAARRGPWRRQGVDHGGQRGGPRLVRKKPGLRRIGESSNKLIQQIIQEEAYKLMQEGWLSDVWAAATGQRNREYAAPQRWEGRPAPAPSAPKRLSPEEEAATWTVTDEEGPVDDPETAAWNKAEEARAKKAQKSNYLEGDPTTHLAPEYHEDTDDPRLRTPERLQQIDRTQPGSPHFRKLPSDMSRQVAE